MISVQEALKIVKENCPPSRVETLSVERADGRIICRDIFAQEPSPAFDNSAMDGYAVRWDDVRNASADHPVKLALVGESRAGVPFDAGIDSGTAIGINTGAMLPSGADSVVPIEDSRKHSDHVEVLLVKEKNQNVRFKGTEFEAGELLIKNETTINPAHIGLMISQGIKEIDVYAKARIAIIVTGSELVGIGEARSPGQIHDSNSPMLAAAAARAGGEIAHRETVGDDKKLTSLALSKATNKADIIILSGGVSVGEHDFVKPAAQEMGFETLIWRVNQRPGKPLFFARKGKTLLFGLPGNPVSAMMCFLYYVAPVIGKFSGRKPEDSDFKARLQDTFTNRSKRPQFVRVSIRAANERALGANSTEHDMPASGNHVTPLMRQASHMLTSLTEADGFIYVDSESTIDKDNLVDVIPFPWFRNRSGRSM